MDKIQIQKIKEEYKLTRNEYVMVRREEEKLYEKDVDMCKEELKLFYKYINGKIKHKKSVARLKGNKYKYMRTQNK